MNAQVTLARWIAGLLAISAIAFALAVLLENHKAGEVGEPNPVTAEILGRGGEVGDVHQEGGASAEEFLGVNLESPWLVWGFVVVSLLVAAAVLRLWILAFLLAVLLAGLAAVLDVREVVNQMDDGNSLIAILAVLIALAHVAAAVLAIMVLTRDRQRAAISGDR